MSLINTIKEYYSLHPLRTVLLVGFVLRLTAAVFSEGYAFHDDHFCVTRVAQSWADGVPHWVESDTPPKHSMFYAGINASVIWVSQQIGVEDPYTKTMVLRIMHALYAMLTIFFVYKIALLLSDQKKALLASWITALLWFMPFMSVRFLAELVCVPPILIGFYLIIKQTKGETKGLLPWLLAGALMGLAFTFRLHTILFAGGIGLVMLFRKQWLQSVLFSVGFILAAFIIIGIPDMIFFDYPFHSIKEYFDYNSANANNYISGSPFKFTLTTFGFLVPPVSVFLMFGYLKASKIEPMMFVAVLVFFLFHSAFPNQQERFIMPMFPLVIILGVIGWQNFAENSTFWIKHKSWLTGGWRFFWTINIIAAVAMALTFSKKDRIEPIHYLYEQNDVSSVIIENEKGIKQIPTFFIGKKASDINEWDHDILGINQFLEDKKYLNEDYRVVFSLPAEKTIEQLQVELNFAGKKPNYIIFQGANELKDRIERVKPLFDDKQLILKTTVSPSNFDKLLHFLNPRVHRDQTAFVYRAE